MRLPYLQFSSDLVVHAADLAVELGVTTNEARGALVALVAWALSRCPDNAPPSANDTVMGPHAARMLARAAEFAGDPEAFVDACCRVAPSPILERIEGGIRIRGLDRYDAAWGKNNPKEWPAWKAFLSGTGPDPRLSRAEVGTKPERNRTEPVPKSEPQTQMQMHTQKKDRGSRERAPAPVETPLRERLEAEFERQRGSKYGWSSRVDDAAIRSLLLLAPTDEEILRRWGIALAQKAFPRCDALKHLVQNWNSYTPPVAAPEPQSEFRDYDGAEDLYPDFEPAGAP